MTTMFLVIALVASAFLALQLLLLMFGADMDFDSDMDVEASDGGGFMSVRSLTAFFGGFGWAGLAARQAGWSGAASLLLGLAVGVAFFVIAGFLFMEARKLTSSGNVDYGSSVGLVGTVYLSVPPNRNGAGKVEVNASGRVSIVSAMSSDEVALPSSTRVRVIEVIDSTTVLVERA